MSRPRFVAIVGPTATGKTALALEVAEAVGGEIVSADARQIYRRLDIGTAKPTVAERARVPHHCLDLAEPVERFDVGRFRAAATQAIDRLTRAGRPIVIAGGTGLYVRVLLRGLCATGVPNERLRDALTRAAEREPAELRRWLERLDSPAALRIHPNDRVRTVRALEVALSSGRRLSDQQSEHAFKESPYEALVLALAVPPATLAHRIEARVHSMVAAGWLDEVAALATDVPADAPGWQTLGYRELRGHLAGECTLDEALASTVSATRRLAKRQRTWFRAEPGLRWVDPVLDRGSVVAQARAFLVANQPDAG